MAKRTWLTRIVLVNNGKIEGLDNSRVVYHRIPDKFARDVAVHIGATIEQLQACGSDLRQLQQAKLLGKYWMNGDIDKSKHPYFDTLAILNGKDRLSYHCNEILHQKKSTSLLTRSLVSVDAYSKAWLEQNFLESSSNLEDSVHFYEQLAFMDEHCWIPGQGTCKEEYDLEDAGMLRATLSLRKVCPAVYQVQKPFFLEADSNSCMHYKVFAKKMKEKADTLEGDDAAEQQTRDNHKFLQDGFQQPEEEPQVELHFKRFRRGRAKKCATTLPIQTSFSAEDKDALQQWEDLQKRVLGNDATAAALAMRVVHGSDGSDIDRARMLVALLAEPPEKKNKDEKQPLAPAQEGSDEEMPLAKDMVEARLEDDDAVNSLEQQGQSSATVLVPESPAQSSAEVPILDAEPAYDFLGGWGLYRTQVREYEILTEAQNVFAASYIDAPDDLKSSKWLLVQYHENAPLGEIIKWLQAKMPFIFFDATSGAGGHLVFMYKANQHNIRKLLKVGMLRPEKVQVAKFDKGKGRAKAKQTQYNLLTGFQQLPGKQVTNMYLGKVSDVKEYTAKPYWMQSNM